MTLKIILLTIGFCTILVVGKITYAACPNPITVDFNESSAKGNLVIDDRVSCFAMVAEIHLENTGNTSLTELRMFINKKEKNITTCEKLRKIREDLPPFYEEVNKSICQTLLPQERSRIFLPLYLLIPYVFEEVMSKWDMDVKDRFIAELAYRNWKEPVKVTFMSSEGAYAEALVSKGMTLPQISLFTFTDAIYSVVSISLGIVFIFLISRRIGWRSRLFLQPDRRKVLVAFLFTIILISIWQCSLCTSEHCWIILPPLVCSKPFFFLLLPLYIPPFAITEIIFLHVGILNELMHEILFIMFAPLVSYIFACAIIWIYDKIFKV